MARVALKIPRSEEAGTIMTGSVRCGKFEEKLTSVRALQAMFTAPTATVAHATSRHREDGSRPSGKKSSVRAKGGKIAASDTVRIQPAHGAPGSEYAPVRDAYSFAATVKARASPSARNSHPILFDVRAATSAPIPANAIVAGE
jgi:hypothetical protein